MLVKTLNPAQEPADAAALLPVFRAYYAEAMPGFPAPGLARLRHWAAAPPRSTAEVYGVFPDGSSTEAVGALFTASGLEANLDMVNSSLTVPLDFGEHSAMVTLTFGSAREISTRFFCSVS